MIFWKRVMIIIACILAVIGWCLYGYDMYKKIKEKNKNEKNSLINNLNYEELPLDIEVQE